MLLFGSGSLAELDHARHLVPGQMALAVRQHIGLGQRRRRCGTTTTFTASPERSSRTPIAAASSTPGCIVKTSSISLGNTLNPETTIMSFLRSVMRMLPLFVHHAHVAGAQPAVRR